MDEQHPAPESRPASSRGADRPRDRGATQARILEAAQAILVEQGSAGFGVNAVARAAGVDKQLIYRYFGGLEGLLEALGQRIADWWQERLLDSAPGSAPDSYGAMMEMLALRLLRTMRSEPLALQSTLWELNDTSGIARGLAAARGRALGAWMERARGALRPPDGIDAPAVNAMIVAAISYLVLASRSSGTVIGLATDTEATWGRIEAAILALVQGAYGHHPSNGRSADIGRQA